MRAELKGRRLGLMAAGALACGVSAAAPAVASATTLSVDHECYRPGQTTRVSGDGYTPGSEVDLSFTIVGASGGVGGDALITQADDAGRVDMNTSGRASVIRPVRGCPGGEGPTSATVAGCRADR